MIDYIIHSYEGVGPVKFGMTPEQVRSVLHSEFTTFMKSKFSEMPTDSFRSLGIHVYYKKPGICNAIELHTISAPLFNGMKLMNEPASKVIKFIKALDPSALIKFQSINSPLLGIDLYIPDLGESSEAPVKAVLAFEKGYFEPPPRAP